MSRSQKLNTFILLSLSTTFTTASAYLAGRGVDILSGAILTSKDTPGKCFAASGALLGLSVALLVAALIVSRPKR